MKKKILIITQYFPPEIGGGSQRSIGFAEELYNLGFDITVIKPFPSYLIKKELISIKFKLFEKYFENGLTIFNTFVYANDRGNFIKRILYYLSFTISSIIVSIIKINKIDYVIAISPPLFTGLTGLLIKKIKKAIFIFDIGDLWPEGAIQLGFLKNKLAIVLAEKLEKTIYKNSDIINVVTKLTLDKLKSLHPYIKTILYVPNFVNTNLVKKLQKDTTIIERLNLKKKMVVGYAGNIGKAQGCRIITQSALITKNIKDIVYIIIGDGVEKDSLVDDINKMHLDNVLILDPVTREDIIRYISVFDTVIIPLVKNELFKITIPSKLYESMAAEIPILLCVDGEARKIVEESKCGFFIEPENAELLAANIIELFNNIEMLGKLGKNGRTMAENEFNRKTVIQKFAQELSS